MTITWLKTNIGTWNTNSHLIMRVSDPTKMKLSGVVPSASKDSQVENGKRPSFGYYPLDACLGRRGFLFFFWNKRNDP
ncbi:hypothetical protein NC651_005956 [Populus alba x Populus x berolinensis]|nr:hypothetical protein NC651_005956 [Populus alba x Populus x berolinensis]